MEFLFVYGTLLTDVKHPKGEMLRALASFIGKGQIPGTLYDLGEYPALVACNETSSSVLGEVYDLSSCPNLWAELDEYEGINDSDTPEYTREKVLVTTADATLTCWTYIYQGIVQNLVPIEGGDYLSYFKEREDHRGDGETKGLREHRDHGEGKDDIEKSL
ncbi:gamma-glutamylcyclotransferase family protein [Lunatibacter salilacus]|uniref:gamma-glutamylcyclotransferase family protein n=1 Tax=Lunatibacter salilacus TaxID=2483804 RepID=UPI00131E57BD|nr:gamma-glutamylcyclotransferase family protein [Lunatibacter salilacus]